MPSRVLVKILSLGHGAEHTVEIDAIVDVHGDVVQRFIGRPELYQGWFVRFIDFGAGDWKSL